MDTLKKNFEKFYGKYLQKKDFFQRTIDTWGAKGRVASYKKGSQLISEAGRVAQELKQEFAFDGAGEHVTFSLLKEKVKKFKSIYKELYESTKPAWRQWLEAIIIALILAAILRHTIFSPYSVPSGSAEPTILVGDRIWGNKMAYYFNEIKRGDYIIFDDSQYDYDRSNFIQHAWQRLVGFPIPFLGLKSGPMNVTKRIIAIPGDTIEGRIENNKTVIYLNGKKLEEPYVNRYPLISLHKTTGFFSSEGFGPFKIPDFLRLRSFEEVCTYDPSKPYDKQPFYTMTEGNVVKNPGTGQPIFRLPFTSSYSLKISDQNYTLKMGAEGSFNYDIFGPLTLPHDMYWVMGDNRKNSADSRYWGPLHRKLIRGRVSFILFSLDSWEVFWLFDLMKHPIDFWTKHIRWDRFFRGLDEYQGLSQTTKK